MARSESVLIISKVKRKASRRQLHRLVRLPIVDLAECGQLDARSMRASAVCLSSPFYSLISISRSIPTSACVNLPEASVVTGISQWST